MSRFTPQTSKSASSLLKDNSWIRKVDQEEENIDQDPNFGRSVLGARYRSTETLDSSEAEDTKTTKTISSSTSVHSLTKRFSGSQDELRSSNLPSSKSTSSHSKTTYSTLKSNSPNTITTSKTIITEEPKTGTTTTTVTKDGKTTTETITTTQSLRSPVLKSPNKTETFTERVKSSSKGLYTNYSPTKTTKGTETTVTSNKDVEDTLLDDLSLSSITSDLPPTDSTTKVSSTETVTVKSSGNGNSIKTTTKTKTLSTAEDSLYDTLLPKSITSSLPKDSNTAVSRTETVLVKSSTDTKADGNLNLSSLKNNFAPMDSKVSSTETVTVKSSGNGNGTKTTTTTRTSSRADDNLYGTLMTKSITSNMSSPGGGSPTLASPSSTRKTTSYSSYSDDSPFTRTTSYTISSSSDDYNGDRKSYSYSRPDFSDDYNGDRKSYSYSRPDSSYEYSSVTSPSVYSSTSYRSSSRSDDSLTDPIYSKSSTTSVYAAPERTVLEKDLCTVCRKPFTSDAKMVLDDMKINCHASCFKCAVCNSTLGNMKAGDSMWIYKRMVHCENCFEVTRDKWRR